MEELDSTESPWLKFKKHQKYQKSNGIKLNVSTGFHAQLGVSHAVTMAHYLQSIRPCFRPHGLWRSLFLHPVSFPFCVLVHFSLSCLYRHGVCVCARAPTVAGGVISLVIHHQGKFPLPPQKFEQTASAGTDIIKHTNHTREFLARGFGGTEHGFLPPYDTMVFYSQLLEGCYMHFRSRFSCASPSQC